MQKHSTKNWAVFLKMAKFIKNKARLRNCRGPEETDMSTKCAANWVVEGKKDSRGKLVKSESSVEFSSQQYSSVGFVGATNVPW